MTSDWSAAYTPNAGPMDAVVKIQLTAERKKSAQEYVRQLRQRACEQLSVQRPRVRLRRRRHGPLGDERGQVDTHQHPGHRQGPEDRASDRHVDQERGQGIDGVVDARIIQRLDYPMYVINVDRAKAAELGLTPGRRDGNVIAALNSSIQFNKHNFWIDPKSKNQYFVGVSYFEKDIKSIETLLDIPITSPVQSQPIPMRNVVTVERAPVATEVTALQHPADDRAEHGRAWIATWATCPTTWPRSSTSSESQGKGAVLGRLRSRRARRRSYSREPRSCSAASTSA